MKNRSFAISTFILGLTVLSFYVIVWPLDGTFVATYTASSIVVVQFDLGKLWGVCAIGIMVAGVVLYSIPFLGRIRKRIQSRMETSFITGYLLTMFSSGGLAAGLSFGWRDGWYAMRFLLLFLSFAGFASGIVVLARWIIPHYIVEVVNPKKRVEKK